MSARTKILTPGVPCIMCTPGSSTDRGGRSNRSFSLISPRRDGGATLLYPDAPVESTFCSATQQVENLLQNPDATLRPNGFPEQDAVSNHSYPGSHKDAKVSTMKAQQWRIDLGRLLQRKFKDLRVAFREIDLNKDHCIDEREMVALFDKLQLPLKDAKSLFRHMDKEGRGEINFQQFQEEFGKCVAGSYEPAKDPWQSEMSTIGGLAEPRIYLKEPHLLHGGQRQHRKTHVHGYWKPPKSEKNSDPYAGLSQIEGLEHKVQTQYATVLKAFREIDEDKSGSLSRDELGKLFEKFNLPGGALDKVFDRIDVDQSNEITFEEFKKRFGPIIQPCVGTLVTNFHHVTDYGTRFSPINNQYEEIASKQAPLSSRDPQKHLPWLKKEDPNWIQRVQMGSSRALRSVPPQRGVALHPERAKYNELEKDLPRLPSNECTWAGPDSKRYHPHILEAAPSFTYQGRKQWSPYTRKQTMIDYSERINDNHLENICERKLHHGRMEQGHLGKSISDPIATWL